MLRSRFLSLPSHRLNTIEHRAGGNLQGLCEYEYGAQRWVAHASFKHADECPVDSAGKSKRFLAEASGRSRFSKGLTKRFGDVGFEFIHPERMGAT